MQDLDTYAWVSLIIVLIGGICWGLVGVFNIYLVNAIFGYWLGRIIYVVVGIAAVYLCYHIYEKKFKKSA